jgi:hypothetical protein
MQDRQLLHHNDALQLRLTRRTLDGNQNPWQLMLPNVLTPRFCQRPEDYTAASSTATDYCCRYHRQFYHCRLLPPLATNSCRCYHRYRCQLYCYRHP